MNNTSLFAVCQQFCRLNQRIRCDHTEHQYLIALRNFRDAIGHEPHLCDLTDDNVSATMEWLLQRNLAIRTINERRGKVNALWSWCAKCGLVQSWPTIGPMPEPERVPTAWTRDQLAKLLTACDHERMMIGGLAGPIWWRTLHLALWDTGERITALLNSCWSDLDGEWLTIRAEKRKGKRKDMTYRMSSQTLLALEKIREPSRELIWPWPHDRKYVWIRYRELRKRAGLPTDRRSSFHRMRRSVASHYEAAGGNSTELLGHASRSITTKSYLDPRIVRQQHASEVLFRIED